ncbi:MAG: UDP-N-acetylmuramoyl-tripeptide--D-alanyl-D-alanine ligase [Actinobacteria bacterium]|nr:UDP-N-acetylmuramoyl-tripeptide--D-alanyl-D-alanine ligase [Actinomycetota bacterium]
MIPFSLDEIEALCPGRLERAPWADEVTGVQVDSRRIDEGDLFVAIGDGTDYLPHAFARGAAGVLVADDAFSALAALGSAVRARSSAKIVGITGSTGKTSTKDILAGLCSPHAPTVASEGGHNNEIGLPLTLARIDEDTQIVVCEMGMRGIGQIADLCATARPEIGVITSIGPVHLELLGTVECVAEAKAEVVASLPAGGIAIAPADRLLEPYLARDDIEVRRFRPEDVLEFEPAEEQSRLRLKVGKREVELDVPFTARYQALNALAALHAYDALGLPLDEAQRGASGIALSRWRGEEVELPGGGLLINDAYNANPVSMKAALAHLAERAGSRRKVAILGEMAELGPAAPALHAEVGRAARELGVEIVLTVGSLAREYGDARWVETAEEAVTALDDVLRPGDAVIVKASRALGLECVAEVIQAVRVS